MDFLNSRLIAALNHLRAEVHSLRDSIDSNCSEYRNEHERRHTEMLRPVVVNAELQVPEVTEREKARRDDRTHRQQVWLTWGTWLTFVATTAAFAAAAYYAHIARKTFDQ